MEMVIFLAPENAGLEGFRRKPSRRNPHIKPSAKNAKGNIARELGEDGAE